MVRFYLKNKTNVKAKYSKSKFSTSCYSYFENWLFHVSSRFLKFFYTAQVTLDTTNVLGLLCLADKYNVQSYVIRRICSSLLIISLLFSLRNLCSQFMTMKARPPNVRNAIAWYSISKQFSLNDLGVICMHTVAWNIEYLLSLIQI